MFSRLACDSSIMFHSRKYSRLLYLHENCFKLRPLMVIQKELGKKKAPAACCSNPKWKKPGAETGLQEPNWHGLANCLHLPSAHLFFCNFCCLASCKCNWTYACLWASLAGREQIARNAFQVKLVRPRLPGKIARNLNGQYFHLRFIQWRRAGIWTPAAVSLKFFKRRVKWHRLLRNEADLIWRSSRTLASNWSPAFTRNWIATWQHMRNPNPVTKTLSIEEPFRESSLRQFLAAIRNMRLY